MTLPRTLNEAVEQQLEPTTQTGRILKILQKDGEITNAQMWRMKIQRGSERIRELKAEGHVIRSIHLKGPYWIYMYDGQGSPERKSRLRSLFKKIRKALK
ncbi:helix-turn-helix domain-containing protein [Antrihabitans sp. YC2-6]|uniref:helix-turn-helix domain-containing protein n=1 Tax=Antrihabitans sp. YC2-6 TaxID=2799498 RepID=UPI0018F64553|nr:helix-turn-helix domain-containing protein [Antrihabitans sp. YC2-6]MBJ8343974.1 hypothetical protein [Antrihabitans sp. YC2-6]